MPSYINILAKLDFPTWSWYSVNGQVLYRTCSPFYARTERDKRTIANFHDLLPASDAGLPDANILEISCLQHRRYTHICRGRLRIRGLTMRAYFEPKRNSAIFSPRRHGADKQLTKDLGRGKPKPAPHDSDYQPEFSYTFEYPFVDMIDYPGPGGPREVLCMVMGVNTIDGVFPVCLILERIAGRDEYIRVGTMNIDTRALGIYSTCLPGLDNMGDSNGDHCLMKVGTSQMNQPTHQPFTCA